MSLTGQPTFNRAQRPASLLPCDMSASAAEAGAAQITSDGRRCVGNASARAWYRLDEAALQVDAGDRQSPSWTPFRGTDGTPNESVNDVLVRSTRHERAWQMHQHHVMRICTD